MPVRPSLISKFRETLGLLYRRFNALQRGERRCFGLTMSQSVVVELLNLEGPRTVRDLAADLGLDQSTVTRVVDVLVRDRLVSRARDEGGDRRRVFVSLTIRGRVMARKLEACGDQYCEQLLARISPDRRDDVLHALSVVVDALGEAAAGCGGSSNPGAS